MRIEIDIAIGKGKSVYSFRSAAPIPQFAGYE